MVSIKGISGACLSDVNSMSHGSCLTSKNFSEVTSACDCLRGVSTFISFQYYLLETMDECFVHISCTAALFVLGIWLDPEDSKKFCLSLKT